MRKYKIIAPNGIYIELFNSKRAPIDFEDLRLLVNQHKSDSTFYIELRLLGEDVHINQSEVISIYFVATLIGFSFSSYFLESPKLFDGSQLRSHSSRTATKSIFK